MANRAERRRLTPVVPRDDAACGNHTHWLMDFNTNPRVLVKQTEQFDRYAQVLPDAVVYEGN